MPVERVSRGFKDISMSFEINPINDDLITVKNRTAIARSIRNLMLTVPGERLFNEDMGSRVSEVLFDNLDEISASAIRDAIEATIITYESRVKLDNVKVKHKSDNNEFDHYLKRFGYRFKNENKEFGGYAILQDKKISIVMDIGQSPYSNFSSDYQSGALSFEIISNGKKMISNCGYYQGNNEELVKLSKSTEAHNTLIIDDNSSCKFKKIKEKYFIKDSLRLQQKNIILEKHYLKLNASHAV